MPSGSCQRCRQPLAFPASSSSSSSSSSAAVNVDDSIAALSPSTYDLLSASDRLPHPPPPSTAAGGRGAVLAAAPPHPTTTASPVRVPPGLRPLYGVATRHSVVPRATRPQPQRLAVPPSGPTPAPQPPSLPRSLGPAESFVVLTDSVLRPPPSSSSSLPRGPPSPAAGPSSSSSPSSGNPTLLTPHLSQLSSLYSLLSATSSVDHPLCTECVEVLLALLARHLDEAKKERDRLVGFEKDVVRRRDEAVKAAGGRDVDLREQLEKDIAKLRKAESHAIAELKAVEAQKAALADDKAALDAEEAQLAQEEADFWRQHSLYLTERDALRDRESALETRLATGRRDLDKLQRTNVYNDAFCIGQEAGFGTINGLRLGRLPGVSVEWPEINAAWGHTLLLLHTVARKFGCPPFAGYRLVPCGSFSCIEKLGEGGEVVQVLELYGSGDFAVTRLLQNRRFDHAMVAFLECLRQLSEWVTARDARVRLPHAVVKDRIGDVSIKLQFGSDEAWTRALRHVLLDLKILLGRASL
ncbi:autophagy protein Apg6-domain-containing protein [Rhodotorula diobovata]|uniref:Autophagy protein Apg6-domain-containing protein n=1 Tax=Rhodotorula diobovata TaxID=5288 RepID=A0A5C5FXI1_9BASI|nr:autophagy protein Apg6-domain-containing protein [Rhodotorula diobovata]